MDATAVVGIIATAAVGVAAIVAQAVNAHFDRESRRNLATDERSHARQLAADERAHTRRHAAYVAAAEMLQRIRYRVAKEERTIDEWMRVEALVAIAGPPEVADALRAVQAAVRTASARQRELQDSLDMQGVPRDETRTADLQAAFSAAERDVREAVNAAERLTVCELGFEGVVAKNQRQHVQARRAWLGEGQEPELLAAGLRDGSDAEGCPPRSRDPLRLTPRPVEGWRHDDFEECRKRTRFSFDSRCHESFTAVSQHDHVAGLEVRSRMLKEAKVVAVSWRR